MMIDVGNARCEQVVMMDASHTRNSETELWHEVSDEVRSCNVYNESRTEDTKWKRLNLFEELDRLRKLPR